MRFCSEGSLQVYRGETAGAPDAANSWLNLSVGRSGARAGEPITGVVLVRDGEQRPTAGGQLALHLDFASELMPITQLAPGLWKFVFQPIQPGQAAVVEVTLDGQLVGQADSGLAGQRLLELPWSPVHPRISPNCAVATYSGPRPNPGWTAWSAIAALLWVVRRYRRRRYRCVAKFLLSKHQIHP